MKPIRLRQRSQWILCGHSTKEIASILCRIPKTVETHRINPDAQTEHPFVNKLMQMAIRWNGSQSAWVI